MQLVVPMELKTMIGSLPQAQSRVTRVMTSVAEEQEEAASTRRCVGGRRAASRAVRQRTTRFILINKK